MLQPVKGETCRPVLVVVSPIVEKWLDSLGLWKIQASLNTLMCSATRLTPRSVMANASTKHGDTQPRFKTLRVVLIRLINIHLPRYTKSVDGQWVICMNGEDNNMGPLLDTIMSDNTGQIS